MQALVEPTIARSSSPEVLLPTFDPLRPTVFHSTWWLEGVSGGSYQEVEVRSDRKVVARLPYVVERRFGTHSLCRMPDMTHFLGPAIDLGNGASTNQSLKRYQLTQELIASLGSFSSFHQVMHRGVPDTLAFESAGYSTRVAFTYEIQPQPIQTIWAEMRDKTRNVIRRATEQSEIIVMNDPYAFAAVYEENLRSRQIVNTYTRIGIMCEKALLRNQGCLLAAKSRTGAVLGAIFLVWDQQAAYYLLTTRSPEADNGVISLLIWEAICLTVKMKLIFDFDGLGAPGSRVFFTGFGGHIKPRYIVAKHSFSYRTLCAGCRILQIGV